MGAFKYSATNWAELYMQAPLCAIFGQDFNFSVVIIPQDANLYLFTIT